MKETKWFVQVLLLASFLTINSHAQQSDPASSNNGSSPVTSGLDSNPVPRIIKFSGTINPAGGAGNSGRKTSVGLTFSFYELQEGGSPLWSESQEVQLDELGHYAVLLGATQAAGLPLDLFTSGKALWLGVQPQLTGAVEQARVLLVAVPYALKASDSDTLGGRPASDYALAGSQTLAVPAGGAALSPASTITPKPGSQAGAASGTPSSPQSGACSSVTTDGTATANSIAMFTTNCNLEASAITQTSGNIGIGGASPTGTKFQITDTPAADFGTHYTNHELLNSSVTKNGTNKGLTFVMDASNTMIPAGVTDSGYRIGVEGAAYANTVGFAGMLGAQYGVWGRAGINAATSGAAVSNAYAGYFDIFNGTAGTTITNAYGVYITNSATTGAITNRYDLYAASANANNYFAGNVGVGTTAPAAKLEVNGTTKFDAAVTFAAGQAFPISNSAVTNSMLQNSSLTINTGAGLSGGGTLALGASLSLSNTGVLGVGTATGSGILVGGTAANPSLSADLSVLATNTSVSSAVAGGVTTAEDFTTSAINTAGSAITGSTLTLNTASPITGGPVTFNPGTNASVTLGVNTSALESTLNSAYAQLTTPNTFTMPQTLSGGGVLAATGTATSGAPASSNALDLLASSWNGSQAVTEQFRWQAEGNGSADAGSLNLLSATGTQPLQETGLSISSNGVISFASGQTFPSSMGTVTSVASGAGLTGGPITTSGTLSIATGGVTNAMLQNPSLTINSGTGLSGGGTVALGGSLNLNNTGVLSVTPGTDLTSNGTTGSVTLNLDTTKVPTLAAASNIFSGSVSAASFSGNGSALTSLSPANLASGTAAISITGNAATASTAGSATTATTAANATNLGGLAASNYARLDVGNSFNGNQSIAGNLTVTGSLLSGASAALAGPLTGVTANFSGALTAAAGAMLPATGSATASAGAKSEPLDLLASSFSSTSATALNQDFRWQAEAAGNNTALPSGTLNLLYASGNGTPAETGLSIASNGTITFAPGQTFPGGAGTVTSVASGAGLTGGPITSSGTISIASAGVTNSMLANPTLSVTAGSGLTGGGTVALGSSTTLSVASAGITNTMLANSSLTVTPGTDLTGGGVVALGSAVTLNLDTTKVPQLNASNTFTGGITANSFTGNGSALTNVNATTLAGLGANAFAQLAATTNTFTGSLAAGGVTASSFTSTGAGAFVLSGTEGACAGAMAGKDVLCLGDGTSHTAQLSLNGGAFVSVATTSPASITNAMLANSSLTVTPGTDLTGGGVVALGSAVTLNLDTTKVPQLNASNTFTGGITASSFTGNGSALTNVNAATLSGLGTNAFAQLAAAGNSFAGSLTAGSVTASSFSSTGAGAFVLSGTEGACSGATAGKDVLCLGDATSHTAQVSLNGGAFVSIPQLAANTTATVGGSAISAQTCSGTSVSIPAAATSMNVLAQPAGALGSNWNSVTWQAYVSASGTVMVRLCNISASSVTPASMTFNIRLVN